MHSEFNKEVVEMTNQDFQQKLHHLTDEEIKWAEQNCIIRDPHEGGEPPNDGTSRHNLPFQRLISVPISDKSADKLFYNNYIKLLNNLSQKYYGKFKS